MASDGWISVKDRLPKNHDMVIVHGGIAYRREDEWYTLTGESYPGKVIQWTVEYWMPFPGAPPEATR